MLELTCSIKIYHSEVGIQLASLKKKRYAIECGAWLC